MLPVISLLLLLSSVSVLLLPLGAFATAATTSTSSSGEVTTTATPTSNEITAPPVVTMTVDEFYTTNATTTSAPPIGYLQPPPGLGVSRHLCCEYNAESPRVRDGPFNGFKVTMPKATNATASVDAGCNVPSTFPRMYTKEFAACDFCACLWYYGAPARKRCCSVTEFGLPGVDPDSGWDYCTELYHVMETRSGGNDIHICELFYDIYPFSALSSARPSGKKSILGSSGQWLLMCAFGVQLLFLLSGPGASTSEGHGSELWELRCKRTAAPRIDAAPAGKSTTREFTIVDSAGHDHDRHFYRDTGCDDGQTREQGAAEYFFPRRRPSPRTVSLPVFVSVLRGVRLTPGDHG
mmetsp:Transcript_12296/g.29846  ORF Transcript_12296/g.29846 Transcript_12296/m.29846 type:complete len:351 (+) Transcript_12296:478-1530(+)